MKQIEQSYRTGRLSVVEVPAPAIPAGSVLVATRASLISAGTERQLMDLARASLAGKAMARPDLVRRVARNIGREGLRPTLQKVFAKLDTPIPLGYSLAGQVVEAGRAAQGLSPGTRVACAGAGFASHAEFNAVPKTLAVPIPDAVSDEEAAFVTLGAIALQAVRQAQPTIGERIVVMGLGLIGLIVVQLLKASGCRVVGYDPLPARAEAAAQLGADLALASGLEETVLGVTGNAGADAVIIAASTKSSEPLNRAAEISRIKGRIVVVGNVGMTLDREPFYKRELDLRLSMSSGPGRYDPAYEIEGHDYPLPYVRWTEQRNMQAFLELVAAGSVTPRSLITHRFPIGEAEQAYALMERGEPHLAILLTYGDPPPAPARSLVSRIPAAGGDGVAFIGFGAYAKSMLLPAFKRDPRVALTTVVTATGLSAGHAAEKHRFRVMATDPEAAFGDPATAAVVIATRHDTHAALASRALLAGKHVFCEKPLALREEELSDVLAAAEQAPGLLTVGFNRRFAPLLVKARAALEPRSGPLVMLYRVNAGTIPPDSWIARDEGGGRVIGEVCHFVDALTFLAGSLPVKAQAIGAKGYGDAVSILISFADGSTGTIIYSSLGDAAVSKEYVEVFASGRVVQLDDFERLTVTAAGKRSVTKAARDKGQRALVAAFLAAMRGERDAPIPLADLAAVCEATFAIARSLSGRLQEQPAPREVPPEDASPIPQDMANAERSGMPAEDFA